ncbi:uncharacterized protein [Temnothorax longispinosus]|uniref:uncharacterized protein isoform X2 n=1 Tax=Temnothorax longispinosus TaxID=300112 RepID=UPI003A99E5E7
MVVIWCALCVSNQVERGICFMATDDSWKTQHFRQSVVAKIDEAIQVSGMPTTKNSMEMENHVFQKAKTKEEYLGFVARLILHLREMNSKKGAAGNVPGTSGNQGIPDKDDSWKTQHFRQNVVAKIDEAIQVSGMPTTKNSMEMENHVFQKAKTKEEYFGFVARLILHLREMNSKKDAAGNAPGTAGTNNQGMPDLIGALQTLSELSL